MKTSLKWLRNYVDIPWDVKGLTHALTTAGLEVEGVDTIGAIPDGVVVAEILSREKHPNADKLSVCRVSTGAGEPLQIVCGAPNCDAGVKVPLATVGTVLGEGMKISRAKLRGVESFGMLCSARELGLSTEHAGLLHLPAGAPVGRPVAEVLGSDTVVDWEITPNRPDWLSHIGIAREIAAVSGRPEALRLPAVNLQPVSGTLAAEVAAVDVQAPDLCPRYIARVIRNVKIGPSPDWMQAALRAVGMRPINNVVDITNYVMMECGQPLHAFDYERLAAHTIVVRRARDGETITLLDGTVRNLTSANLLIADAEKGVALAGVMGGQNSEIGEGTGTVLLESAVFLPANIRATAKKLGLGTDSSYRFERGVGYDMCEFASARAAALICELAGGELLGGKIDAYPKPYHPHTVRCRVQRACDLLGVTLTADDLAGFFIRLGLSIAHKGTSEVDVSVPSFRLDLDREADLIEEIARLYGLDRIPEIRATAQVGGPMASDAYYPIQEAREQLLGLGLTEVMNYSLLSVKTATGGTGVGESQLVMLSNPISAENCCMRPSLLPGILQNMAHNIAHQNHDLALFELGRVIVHAPELPEERYQVAILLTGRPHPERFGGERTTVCDFYDMKGLLEGLLAARRVGGLECRPATHPAFKSGQAAELLSGGVPVAVFGEVTNDLTAGTRVGNPVFVALVELCRLADVAVAPRRFVALPQFPSTARDISMVAPLDLTHEAIVDAILGFRQPWVEKVELFDIFDDEKVLGKGRRSLAYSLTYRDRTRTLTDEEVNAAHEKLKADLAKQFSVEYR